MSCHLRKFIDRNLNKKRFTAMMILSCHHNFAVLAYKKLNRPVDEKYISYTPTYIHLQIQL